MKKKQMDKKRKVMKEFMSAYLKLQVFKALRKRIVMINEDYNDLQDIPTKDELLKLI